jgi:peptidylprolyl isomerase
VAGSNRDRQRLSRTQSRTEAAAAERRKAAERRRTFVAAGIAAAVILIIVVAIVARSGDDKASVATGADAGTASGASTTSPPTTAALESVAGKPCVALAEPLPTGAPNVPIKVGPPPTELISEDLKEGDGAEVTASSTLTVNYIGVSCSTGKVFDSSWSRGQPATFPLSNVIKGWQNGLPGMKVGGQRLLGIPASMAYGSEGRPPTIAPDEALWFVVDVVDAT